MYESFCQIQDGDWLFPIPIHFGLNSSDRTRKIAEKYHIKKPLIVCDKNLLRLTFAKKIISQFEVDHSTLSIFSDFSANPKEEEVLLGLEIFKENDRDGIIAIGGGSSLDLAKAIALSRHASPKEFWDNDIYNFSISKKTNIEFPPVICVPTTAGTGAEVDPGAVITKTSTQEKRILFHHRFKVKAAILDPKCSVSLPKTMTAWTGIDALVHAVEAFLVPSYNPICDVIALEAVRIIGLSLEKSFHNGADINSRAEMMVAACMAGVAFSKGLGVVHAVSHAVGGLFDTNHGQTNAVIFPHALKLNYKHVEDKLSIIAKALGAKEANFSSLESWIGDLYRECQIPNRLSQLGVSYEYAPEIASRAINDICLATNPRKISKIELEEFVTTLI